MEYKLTPYQQGLQKEWVQAIIFNKMGEKITVAHLTLKNGFEVVGVAGCEDPSKFDYEIGKHFALVDALSKVDPLVSFLKQSTPEVLRMDNQVSPEVLQAIKDATTEGIGRFIQVINDPSKPPGMRGFGY